MEIRTLLKELTDTFSIGHLDGAREIIGRYLDFCQIKNTGSNGLIATLNSGCEKTLLFDAHVDEIGMIVTDVSNDGFITVSNAGGIDLRHLPSKEVIIHGKEKITGIFSSTPPHLSKGEEKCADSIDKIKIDTGLGDKAEKIISKGDFVTFKNTFLELGANRVCAKALDNRAGCATLILLANMLKSEALPVNVAFLFSDSEELGLRGARTSAYNIDTNEAVVVDVSFGNAPSIDSQKCGKLGKGAMIGISPILSGDISNKLLILSDDKNIPCQKEVMAEATGTNADVISLLKSGIKTGLVSLPLRNMHTDCEIIDLRDIENTATLLYHYVLGGGSNA